MESDSVFNRVFSYRERENNSPLENFLTEIFAFCLSYDLKFRTDFINSFSSLKSNIEDFNVVTQESYVGLGRPDIEINFLKTTILIECKVESSERENQLSDYISILKKHKKDSDRKIIIFLTKYYEYREFNESEIEFYLIRWFEVCDIISEENREITQQLKLFLIEQNMEKVKNFNLQDLLAMKTIAGTMSKMDELLEQFKPIFEKEFGAYSKDSSRSTRLQNSIYINYVTLHYEGQDYWLLIGFFWWWDEIEIPYLGVSVEIPSKKHEKNDLVKLLRKELHQARGWEEEDDEKQIFFTSAKPLTEFIIADDDNIPAMKKYLTEQIEKLIELRNKYPKLFRKTK